MPPNTKNLGIKWSKFCRQRWRGQNPTRQCGSTRWAEACHNASPLSPSAMAEDDPKQKMRAFDDEVALTVAPFYLVRMLQRTLPAGFIAPCLPTKTDKLPSGGDWLHEIKHDGFRIIARKKGSQVRLYSRPGNDLTRRFPLIVETLGRLRSRSCIIDGEAVALTKTRPAPTERCSKQSPTLGLVSLLPPVEYDHAYEGDVLTIVPHRQRAYRMSTKR